MNNSKTPAAVTITVEPKKSARLAQKRKLREEAGPPLGDDDYYFSSFCYGKTSTSTYGKSNSQSSPTPQPIANKIEHTKGKQGKNVAPVVKSPVSETKSPPKRCIDLNLTYGKSSRSPNISWLYKRLELDDKSDKLDKSKKIPSCYSPLSIQKSFSETPSELLCDDEVPDFSNAIEEGGENLEEEKWLDALEAGNLEELDEELRQIKNPTVLTARQRAILEKRDKNVILFDEPEGSGTKDKVMTEEMIQLKAQKSERRRLLAQAKKENDQKKTVEKLLNKPYSKGGRNSGKNKGPRKPVGPTTTYLFRKDANFIIYPPNMEIPMKKSISTICQSRAVECGVSGCSNPKKYSCSKTGVPLCSLQCYKKNAHFFGLGLTSVAGSFDCETSMCETSEYESSIIVGEIFTELL